MQSVAVMLYYWWREPKGYPEFLKGVTVDSSLNVEERDFGLRKNAEVHGMHSWP